MQRPNSQPSKALQPPGMMIINGLAIATFLISLYCSSTPALQILSATTVTTVVLAPALFLLDVHLGIMLFLLDVHLGRMPWMSLWVVVFWSWLICGIRYWKGRDRKGSRIRWWVVPILLWIVALLWVTRVPIAINFAMHQSAFDQVADRVQRQSQTIVDLDQQIGLFHVIGATKLIREGKPASGVAIGIAGIGAHQGFVRYESEPVDQLTAHTYSFAPGSNNGDQAVYYLGSGWYVFQNFFD